MTGALATARRSTSRRAPTQRLVSSRAMTYEGATCPCGSAWFTLIPEAADTPPGFPTKVFGPAAVCMDHEGHITGYSGLLVCRECGTQWRGLRSQLVVVPKMGARDAELGDGTVNTVFITQDDVDAHNERKLREILDGE